MISLLFSTFWLTAPPLCRSGSVLRIPLACRGCISVKGWQVSMHLVLWVWWLPTGDRSMELVPHRTTVIVSRPYLSRGRRHSLKRVSHSIVSHIWSRECHTVHAWWLSTFWATCGTKPRASTPFRRLFFCFPKRPIIIFFLWWLDIRESIYWSQNVKWLVRRWLIKPKERDLFGICYFYLSPWLLLIWRRNPWKYVIWNVLLMGSFHAFKSSPKTTSTLLH